MKKKFDFSAEMAEAESIKSNPKNEYREGRKSPTRYQCTRTCQAE